MIKISKHLRISIKGSLFLLLLFISFPVTGKPPRYTFKFKTIVIDAGHGGKDPGARGAYSFEKNVALAIAKKVQELIKRHKCTAIYNVIMTRNTDK